MKDRILWMTDTFGDRNGVSTVLQAVHREICRRDLPIDILLCSNDIAVADHLIVLKPMSEFTLTFYPQQVVRIPPVIQIMRIFATGGYSRIICSTEGPMGIVGRWMKSRYSADVSFYLHTDWLAFGRDVLGYQAKGVAYMEKLLRIFYKGFDRIFVLNSEQRSWLTGSRMQIDLSKVFLTAHWTDFQEEVGITAGAETFEAVPDKPLLLYAGRLSKEKGVLSLPEIIRMIRNVLPEVRLIIAGTGPAEEELRRLLPEAHFTGWVDNSFLKMLYTKADLLLLPSRFDTFSCVVLEAMASGLPVVAYNTKGPRDIIGHEKNGFLAETQEEMATYVIRYLIDPELRHVMRIAARKRAADYDAVSIMDRLLVDTGIRTNALKI